jgi:predicted glycosyltransferase
LPRRDGNCVPIADAYRAARSVQLLATYQSVKPAAVIFETFPFGRRSLRFELMPLLERIVAAKSRPLVIGSVRDILQVAPKVEREREMLVWAKTWFDAILVHADPRFVRFEETFPLLPELGPPVHYTGFVLTPGDRLPIGKSGGKSGAGGDRSEVVVSAGGGGVGIDLLALALAAQAKSKFGHLTWRVLAGPNIPDAGVERLLREAGPAAIVERSRADFGALLRRAFISISQGGYNTVLDVITSGARPVIVPFTGNGETEQRARAVRLAEHDLAIVVDDRTYTPEILAAAVDEAGTREHWGIWDFDSDGALRSASIVSELIAERARDAA